LRPIWDQLIASTEESGLSPSNGHLGESVLDVAKRVGPVLQQTLYQREYDRPHTLIIISSLNTLNVILKLMGIKRQEEFTHLANGSITKLVNQGKNQFTLA
jgi:broad specificity phosphatase PhoE